MVPGGTDVWQQPSVRIGSCCGCAWNPSDKMIAGSDNTQQQLVCTLFFDVQNSAPKGTEFSVGQKIVWNGREMTVMRADRLYDGQRLHHWEVGLE